MSGFYDQYPQKYSKMSCLVRKEVTVFINTLESMWRIFRREHPEKLLDSLILAKSQIWKNRDNN